jgi:hypothetical protein
MSESPSISKATVASAAVAQQPYAPRQSSASTPTPTKTFESTKRIIGQLRKTARKFASIPKLRRYTSDLHQAANRIELLHNHNKRLRRQIRKLDPENPVLAQIIKELS